MKEVQYIRRNPEPVTLPSAYIVKAFLIHEARRSQQNARRKKRLEWLQGLRTRWSAMKQTSHA